MTTEAQKAARLSSLMKASRPSVPSTDPEEVDIRVGRAMLQVLEEEKAAKAAATPAKDPKAA
jgi:hypothetical protein